jgi:hypothetical protein
LLEERLLLYIAPELLLVDVGEDDLAVELDEGVLVAVDRLTTPEEVRVPFGLYVLLVVAAVVEFDATLPLLDVLYFEVVVLLCVPTELLLVKLLFELLTLLA